MNENTLPITLEMADAVNAARKLSKNVLSSHAFPSLYYWRNAMQLSILCDEDWFAVQCGNKGENAWFCPCGNEEKTLAFIERKLGEPNFSLCYISEGDKAFLEAAFPKRLTFSAVPADYEYIYDIAGQLSLEGGRYANVRTQVHKVEREYAPVTKALTDETLGDALAVIEAWENLPHNYDSNSLGSSGVDGEILRTRAQCGVVGSVLYLDGVPSALSAGFPIDDETFDMVLSKSSQNIQGLSYYSKRELMKQLSPSFKYLNLEEDLGIAGLETMKKRMSPIRWNFIWEANAENEKHDT